MNISHREFYYLLGWTIIVFILGWRTSIWWERKSEDVGPANLTERHPKEGSWTIKRTA